MTHRACQCAKTLSQSSKSFIRLSTEGACSQKYEYLGICKMQALAVDILMMISRFSFVSIWIAWFNTQRLRQNCS